MLGKTHNLILTQFVYNSGILPVYFFINFKPQNKEILVTGYKPPQIKHLYGPNIHILDDPLALTLLAKLCSQETIQPKINRLVAALYRQMICTIISAELPTAKISMPTRMLEHTPRGVWNGNIIDDIKTVIVCVARAGIFPSQVCYDFLNEIVDPTGIRQDHLLMGRTTDPEGHVNGAAIQGAKIGGDIEGRTLVIPDPMGATGTTADTVMRHYQDEVEGDQKKTVAAHLIITPESITNLKEKWPNLIIYAYRLDMGLSPDEILDDPDYIPGSQPDKEQGLNEHGYIVPGGGGFGEVMNNAFV